MSEKLRQKSEYKELNNSENREHQEVLQKSAEKKAKAARHEHADKIEKIRSQVENEAAKTRHEHDSQKNESEKHETHQPTLVNRELKDMAYRRTLKRTQNKLPAPARAFSKFIHQPAVEAVSEFAGKTVARPSGILMGGIFAFLGSSIFLWIARHYGYEYNFLLFALFFIGGFFIGLMVELGLYAANRKSR